jgi:hypothetical protein
LGDGDGVARGAVVEIGADAGVGDGVGTSSAPANETTVNATVTANAGPHHRTLPANTVS